MKALNYKQLNHVVRDINTKIKGNHISNVVVLSKSDILLSFSFYRKEKLLISLSHSAPFISLVEASPSVPSILGYMLEELRKNVKDTIVEEVNTIEKERIVCLKLIKTDEFYSRSQLFLFLELIPTHPNLIIVNESHKVIYATHFTSLDSNRPIIKGMDYSLPEHKEIDDTNMEEDVSIFLKDVESYLPLMMKNRLKEKYQKLIASIRLRIKKAKNKIDVLNKEIENAKNELIYQEYGTMILSYLYDETELEKYIKENNLKYDSSISPTDNANKYFKIYKKAKQTLLVNEEQLRLNDAQIEEYEKDLSLLDVEDESIYLVLSNKYLKTSIPKQEINKLTPYYVTIDGTKIGFGRNANQNDLLTFKRANENYYFLHVENIHANHVVILKMDPSDKDKENAAMVALALINKEAGNIQIAKIKEIKKGKMPGQVLLGKYQVIKINNVTNKIKNSLEKAKRISF